ncbi:MAG: phasin family protein [Acidobacteria bacterium]|nr:phasin family protein [Acidobacteriota bacterium]
MSTKKKNEAIPALKESAYDIWLAGLGAFSLAGEEGSKLFRQLVEKGSELEEANKAKLAKLGEKAADLKVDAKAAMKKVASPVEAGLATAMHRLGVPTREEIVTLTKRVEDLTKLVAQRGQGETASRPKGRAKA